MYPVTSTVANKFKENAVQYLSILVNPVEGDSFELTGADVISKGLSVNRYSASGQSIEIGTCVAAELNLSIENYDGRFDEVVFEGAQLAVSVGVEDDNNILWVPLGYFTVDNAPRRLAVITISALDGMVQFDKDVNLAALNLPSTVKAIVTACCNECNVTLDDSVDLDSLPNADYIVNSVGDQEDLTYRTILQWCCQLMGVNGFMNSSDHLELSWYKKDGIPETVSGVIASFVSNTVIPVSSLVVPLSPVQDLNGYDYPWVGGAGKNIMPNSETMDGWYAGSLASISDGVATLNATSANYYAVINTKKYPIEYYDGTTTYTLSYEYRSSANCLLQIGISSTAVPVDTDGWSRTKYATWKSETVPSSGGVWTRRTVSSRTISTSQLTSGSGEMNSGYIQFYGRTDDVVFEIRHVQLERGSSATSYAPYQNICPIYPSNSKNLLNSEDLVKSGVFDKVGNSYLFSHSGTALADRSTTDAPVSIKAGETVVVSFKYEGTNSATMSVRFHTGSAYVDAGQFSFINNVAKRVVTLSADVVSLQIYFGSSSTGVGEAITVSEVQVEKGTSSTSYAPWQGVSAVQSGRNLLSFPYSDATGTSTNNGITRTVNLDGSFTFSGEATSTATGRLWGGFPTDTAARRWGVPPWLKAGVTYTLSGGLSSAISIRIYTYSKSDPDTGVTKLINSNPNGNSFSFTQEEIDDAQFISILVRIASGTVLSTPVTIYPKIEVGEVATPFEPYRGNVNPISLGQWVYGGTVDIATGVLTVDKAVVTLNGSETWSRQSASNFIYYTAMNTMQKLSDYSGEIISDKLRSATNHTASGTFFVTGYRDSSNQYPTQNWIYVRVDDSVTNATAFKSWLSSNNLQVVYPLATPQTYQLTPTEVELLKGTNNIWVDDSTLSVTFPNVTSLTPPDRFSSDIHENAIEISGVMVKGDENQALVGTDDYALVIEGNDLYPDADVETLANNLNGLIGFNYHPFSASVLPMPYLYPMDMVAVQYRDGWYDCAITEVNFTVSAPTQLKGTGESAQSKSYARINPLTGRERTIIQNLRAEVNATLNKAVNNALDFNQIISNALGLYHTNVPDGQGGFIRYLHDAPDIATSNYIVSETAQGFAWTTNGWNGGNPVWTYGVTSGGFALFKRLSAEGIDVTKASSDYRAEVTPEQFNIYYKNDLIITIDATERAIMTPRLVIPYSSTSINSLRVGQVMWMPTPNGANAVVLGG